MKTYFSAILCCLLAVSAGAAETARKSGNFYRWVDKDGKVHYGERLPPEQAQIGGIKYDASGLNKQVIEGAKTDEQLAQIQRLKHLRGAQERLLAEQADRDKSLLRTFGSEAEILLALQGNLATIDGQSKVLTANLARQQSKLAELESRVASIQQSKHKVPREVAVNLEEVKRQIASYQEQSQKNAAEKKLLQEKADKDVLRLRALKNQPAEGRGTAEAQSGTAADLLVGAVSCAGDCLNAWEAARGFAQQHSLDAPLHTDTDRILRTVDPATEQDIALLITRISEAGGDTLFLDLRCHRSLAGQALCSGPAAATLRGEFRQEVLGALPSTPQQ